MAQPLSYNTLCQGAEFCTPLNMAPGSSNPKNIAIEKKKTSIYVVMFVDNISQL